jgi:adhesin/invasin
MKFGIERNVMCKKKIMVVITWVNIFIQSMLPLLITFTPSIAAANNSRLLTEPAALSSLQTQVYTLREGESVAMLAKKYNMSPNDLRRLNQFRTFARGFDHLQPGDELDVPVSPLPPVLWDEGRSTPVPQQDDSAGRENKVAGFSSQMGSFLAGRPDGNAAASMARGVATGEVNSQIQRWMSQFGTARIQLDMDNKFSLKNSQFDLLVPLSEQGNRLVFTQGSVHRTDGRTQSNLGLGARWFNAGWMLGGNTFLDYDLSRDHARLGGGAEYWRDFLKLGVNGYLRLTNWKDSPDLTDYEERPASGWDVRAQAWLPSLPQLGGKLAYEQYYGREVALFGKDTRQRNPHAITAGLSYTPIPLLTFSAEQRNGGSGKNDTLFGIEFNYQLGVPWRQQIDPSTVKSLRSLAGSRYDLVERNNNIILEYRKKQVISLHTAARVDGYPGERKSLAVSVTGKYGLAQVNWSASSLLAAGGRVEQDGVGAYSVVLPAWQAQGTNTYVISGVAVDTKGNRSNRSETTITVQPPGIDANSPFEPAFSTLSANGKDRQALTLQINDVQQGIVDVDARDITIGVTRDVVPDKGRTGKAGKISVVSEVVRKEAGVYEVIVTSGTREAVVTLTPEVRGVGLTPAVVKISSAAPVKANSTLVLDKTSYVAGDDMQVKVQLKDAQHNPVAGQAAVVQTTAVAGAVIKGSWTDNQDGNYSAVFTATTAGTGLKATLTLADGEVTSTAYAITAAAPVVANSILALDKAGYVAGDDMQVTATLQDAQHNPVAGQDAVVQTTTVAGAVIKGNWTDNQDGTYTSTWTAQIAGPGLKATLTVSDGDVTSAAYDITASAPVKANSTLGLDKTSYVAGSDMQVVATLQDAQHNPVAGQDAVVQTTAVAGAVIKGNWTDNQDGTYTSTWTAQIAGTGLKATLTVSDGTVESAPFDITAAAPVKANSSLGLDKAGYVAGDDMQVVATLQDAQHNPVIGQDAVVQTTTVAGAVIKGNWTDNQDGTYTSTWTAQIAGPGLKATLTVSDGDVESAPFDITAAAPVKANSTLALDKTGYVAGDDMQVKVTLQDAQHNPVAGQDAVVQTTTVAGAVIKGNWTDNQDGTYTSTWTAQIAGTGLKATLTVSDGTVESAPFDITAAAPVKANSTLGLDKARYVAGDDMQVVATLQDAQHNPVIGQDAVVQTTVVAGAVIKGSWTDNQDGTYSGVFTATTAGTGLKATLTVSDGEVTSGAYDITAAAPVKANSDITLDKTRYVAGDDMQVKVTLQDAHNNPVVTGQAAVVNTTAVGGAVIRGDWTDNQDGTWGATFTATTAGTGLKATLTVSDGEVESAPFDITSSAPVKANSSLGLDKTSYVAGDDMQVKVTLQDAQHNPVAGQDAVVKTTAVAGAVIKGNWTDNQDGTYSGMFTATTAGPGLKATLTVSDGEVTSAAYDITAAAPVKANSTLGLDKASYVAGSDMQVKVTLKDAQNNPVAGQAAVVQTTAVGGATLKGSWTDNQDGNYSAVFTAATAGTGLKATLTVSDGEVTSAAYDITASAPVKVNSGITLDKTRYVASDDMQVKVTLKDAQHNPVAGQDAVVQTTAVGGAVIKGNWTDNQDGTYSATFTATTAGTGLKATMMVSDGDVESAPFDITAAAPVKANSTLGLDKASYVAGDDMQVKVTLQDAQHNPVAGQDAVVQTTAVAGATLKGSWTDNQDGTYSGVFTATTAGTGLKATMTVSDGDVESAPFDITASAPVVANSTLGLDKTSYVAGDDMQVKVQLKDAQHNPVAGQAAVVQTTAVAGAVIKGSWTDNQDGNYSAVFTATTAGTGLKATLTLADGEVTSTAYVITASAPVKANSTLGLNKTSYVAGDDMQVRVQLKDAQHNPVAGQDAVVQTTTVAGAVIKGNWTDNQDGTYTSTWTAQIAGPGLKATMTVSDGKVESAPFDITAAAPVKANSTLVLDKNSYVAGSDMQVTVTLQDAQHNPVAGQDAVVQTTAVAGATLKGSWTDNQDGTYSGVFTATTAGTGLKATLTVSDGEVTSAAYDITASAPVKANSTLGLDKASYVTGDDIQVVATLQDAQHNPVAGQAAVVQTTAMPGAMLKGSWTDNQDGTYSGVFTATTAAPGLKATMTVSDGTVESAPFEITAVVLKDVTVNNYTFAKDAGFPTTGFTGATFTLNVTDGSASYFTWTSDASWVTVTDGVVKFTGPGTGDKVTITGTPSNGYGKIIKYSFTLEGWFIKNDSVSMDWLDAGNYCASQGYRLPTVVQMSLHRNYNATQRRGTGALWNEWGSLFHGSYVQSSERRMEAGTDKHYDVGLKNGDIYLSFDTGRYSVACRRDL